MGVTDLRCTRPRMMLSSFIFRRGNSHVHRQTRFFPDHGSPSHAELPPVCCPLSRRALCEAVWLPRPILGHGLRPVDLPRESARDRSLSACTSKQAVSHGSAFPERGAQYSVQSQRTPRLAHLRRFRPVLDPYRPSPPCRRGIGA